MLFECVYLWRVLTVNAHFNPFRNDRRNTIRCDAQIRAHVQARYSRYFQCVTIPFANCVNQFRQQNIEKKNGRKKDTQKSEMNQTK